jgi:RNA polymerase sigma-70 factor (ECF subfamily)
MHTVDPSALVQDHDLMLARHHAGRAVGRAGLTRSDRDDLEQEALFELVRRVRQFDAARGPRDSFVIHVARHAAARVIEQRTAARRCWRRCRASLQDEIETQNGTVALADTVADDDHARRTRGARLNGPERDDLRLDVQDVVDRLPAQLRGVCDLLMKHGSTDAAKALGVPRGTFHDMVRRVRAEFREAGLDAYLTSPAGGRAA